jgi:two-component system chemotaxis response regulator CheB
MPPVKVLVADDSSFMRLILQDILQQNNQIEVVATAHHGKEAFEKTCTLKPDVVLLDLMMPEYDGLYAIEQINAHCPTPIVVISGASSQQIEHIILALEKGAYDFILKPNAGINAKIRQLAPEITQKILQATQAKRSVLASLPHRRHNTNPHTFDHVNYEVVLIGASTGGTTAIEHILLQLPSNFPVPVVIAQHMPHSFIESFARRLQQLTALKVSVASEGMTLLSESLYILPGNCNMVLMQDNLKQVRFKKSKQQFEAYNNPSIDALFFSAASIYRNKAIAILLSGMGRDGAAGMEALIKQGAYTIAQDEQTATIFGMPKEAIERKAVKKVLPIHEIAPFVVGCL